MHQVPDGTVVVIVAERVEIAPREAAPRCPEHAEPCDPIARVCKRARQADQVLPDLNFGDGVDLDRMDRPALRGKTRQQAEQMRAAAHENRNGLARRPRAFAREDFDDMIKLPTSVIAAQGVQLNGLIRRRLANRRGRMKFRCTAHDLVLGGKYALEPPIDPVHDGRCAAEVAREDQWFALNVPDAMLSGFDEQRHFGVAKTVDRLHRIADEKKRPAVACLPPACQEFDELHLRARGVLELVYQQVTDAMIESKQQFRRLINLSEGSLGGKRKLHEVDRLTLGENDA